MSNAVMAQLADSPFEGMTCWTEVEGQKHLHTCLYPLQVLQDTSLDLIDSGKILFASTAALCMSQVCVCSVGLVI